MKLKHFASSAAIATATIAAPAITVVQPAAAATTVYTSNGAYAQLDKSPSGGAASWIWWFGGSTGETWVDYKFYNDRIIRHTGKVEEGVTSSITPGQDVWQIRVCNHYYSGRTTSRIVPTGADRRTSLAGGGGAAPPPTAPPPRGTPSAPQPGAGGHTPEGRGAA
ncbi:hypothetical protein ACIA49_33570, partial [Kribbella sp. NPDC051587]|uniref:hypothetical protein n=1 Tax=Kribbella sp. NPDC051587 TaxID=3364119 RepID=UPI00378BB987